MVAQPEEVEPQSQEDLEEGHFPQILAENKVIRTSTSHPILPSTLAILVEGALSISAMLGDKRVGGGPGATLQIPCETVRPRAVLPLDAKPW